MQDQDRLTQLVQDAQRFVMYHKGAIESYPLQTYMSALLFSPTGSVVRQHFQHEEPRGITITPAMSNGWSACLQTLEGHSNGVTSVAFSHDSARLASASYDKTVKIWDVSNGACLHTLEGHSDWVNSVAFSHDSARLASASDDSTVKIWDASSGACLQSLEGHSDYVRSVAFSHDSARLASSSHDSTVKIWDGSSGACLHTLEGHSSYVSSVAFSHDSARLASASGDKTVKIWDASNGACLQILQLGKSVYDVSFDSTSSFLHTEIGTIALQSAEGPSMMDVTELERSLYVGIGLSPDSIWIKHNGENMLWIPSEYRPSCSSISETVIGVGNGSGRVWLCRINI
jgi:WD40 repeat protein